MPGHLQRLASAVAFACVVCGGVAAWCYCDLVAPEPLNDLILVANVVDANRRKRARNVVRDREGPLAQIATWTDEFFRRQFRVTRAEFSNLRESIAPFIRVRNEDMARRSSGSAVRLETKENRCSPRRNSQKGLKTF